MAIDEAGISTGKDHIEYVYTNNGSPLELVMPAEAGEYEIRYIQRQGRRVLARQRVTVR